MKRMWDALGYRCHPCTPYTPKQYNETIVPSTDGINPEISPEESLILCKSLPSPSIPTTLPGIINVIVSILCNNYVINVSNTEMRKR